MQANCLLTRGVWRRRTGSISVSGADATVLRLQVQLLEKCLAHMQTHTLGPWRPPAALMADRRADLSRAGVLAGLDQGDMPRLYRSPALDEVLAAQLLTTLVANPAHRIRALRGFFAGLNGRQGAQGLLLAPAERVALIDGFAERSSAFAATRGYVPDLAALRTAVLAEAWTPAPALPAGLVLHVTEALARTAHLDAATNAQMGEAPRRDPDARRDVLLSIRLRPWMRRLPGGFGLRR